METYIKEHISGIEFGPVQAHGNMSVIPLILSGKGGPEYITLKEALDSKHISIREVSDSGEVSNLKVINNSGLIVLLLDGEELVGAKQNRILNSSILLKKQSETVIPVSCTEEGRWSYESEGLNDSDVVMAHNIRKKKMSSVSHSLKDSNEYHSDQGEIWDDTAAFLRNSSVDSSTGAMKKVFEEKKGDIDAYVNDFPVIDGQQGLFVFINGRPEGFDVVSRDGAYKHYHDKLVRSYAMEALYGEKNGSGKPSVDAAASFMKGIEKCSEDSYKSTGHGMDYRYEGDQIVGSALVYQKKVVHTAFFRIEKDARSDRMASVRNRRYNRM